MDFPYIYSRINRYNLAIMETSFAIKKMDMVMGLGKGCNGKAMNYKDRGKIF